MLRQWQTTIEVAHQPLPYLGSEKQCIYGETVGTLLTAVRAFLLEREPQYFSNRGDYVTGRFQYYYSDGELRRRDLIEGGESQLLDTFPEGMQLLKGWWCRELTATPGSVAVEQFAEDSFRWMESFECAVQHFLRWAVIPERGPDYQPKAFGDSGPPLHLLKKVLREKEEYVVNDLIQRGWCVIALECQGTSSEKEEPVNRHTVFVLGHADLEAAQQTFDVKYYHNYLKLCG
jgi:hypothetical protein